MSKEWFLGALEPRSCGIDAWSPHGAWIKFLS